MNKLYLTLLTILSPLSVGLCFLVASGQVLVLKDTHPFPIIMVLAWFIGAIPYMFAVTIYWLMTYDPYRQ